MKLSMIYEALSKSNSASQILGDCDFCGISTDTRTIEPNYLFVALRGESFDGHHFINQAIANGASAIVVDELIDNAPVAQLLVADTTIALGDIASIIRAKFEGVLVAITGSCGKTSVKGLLRSIFELAGNTLATQGNFNNHIGVPLTLNKLLPSHEYAVIEMGASGGGEISYLANMAQPQISLVNNVRPAHVDGFGSIDAIALEKGKIYDALNNSAEEAVAIINYDDAYAPQFIKQTKSVKQLAFSLIATPADTDINLVYATDIHCDSLGLCQFTIHYDDQKQKASLNVLGEHFVANALAAAACALAAGVSLNTVVRGLAQYSGENGRMQKVSPVYPNQKAILINDAYNANPASVRAAIDYLAAQNTQSHFQRETILVLGKMGELGETEAQEHTAIGLYALEKKITHLVAIGEIAALAAKAFGSANIFKDLVSATAWLRGYLDHEATIILKGSRSAGIDQLIPLLCEYCKEQNKC